MAHCLCKRHKKSSSMNDPPIYTVFTAFETTLPDIKNCKEVPVWRRSLGITRVLPLIRLTHDHGRNSVLSGFKQWDSPCSRFLSSKVSQSKVFHLLQRVLNGKYKRISNQDVGSRWPKISFIIFTRLVLDYKNLFDFGVG